MSYLGNSPELNTFTVGVEKFNGSGACTQFTLTRDIDDPNYIEVVVGGVQQTPYDSYTVTNGVITFLSPPIVGVNNVVAIYRTGTTIAYNQISSSQLLPSSVTELALGPSSVTNSKIGSNAIAGNQIQDNIIRSNNIVVGQITGNLIAPYAVSGNQIGTGAISANNFAGGGITSNVLASNLSISVSRVSEAININSTVIGSNSASGTNVNLDIVNTTVYYFSSNTSGNVTLNLRANTNNTFDSAVEVGNTVSVVVTLRHNTAAYRSGVNVMIDGGLISTSRANPDSGNLIFYSGNTLPAHSPISALETNIIGLNIIKKAANSYIVYMSNTLFGLF
jgi:hypothetical protein